MKRTPHIILLAGAAVTGFAVAMLSRETGDPTASERLDGVAQGAGLTVGNSEDSRVEEVIAALTKDDDFRQLARVGALLEQLSSAEMLRLLSKVDSWPATERRAWLPRLLAHWTLRDPAAATAWIEPRLSALAKSPMFGGMANLDSDMVRAWVDNAPERAVEYARKYAESELGRVILHNAIFAWPDRDHARRLEVLSTFPPGKHRQTVLWSLFSSWIQSRQGRTTALAAAESLPAGLERDGALREVLLHWAGREPEAAWDKAQSLEVQEPAVLRALVCGMAKSDPMKAAQALETVEPALAKELGSVLMSIWAETDPGTAFEWGLKQDMSLCEMPKRRPLGDQYFGAHEVTLQSPLMAAMWKQPRATVDWLCALPAGPDRDRYLELAFHKVRNVTGLGALVAELPPEAGARAAETIAGRMANESVQDARQWAETLPAGPLRLAAWSAIGIRLSEALSLKSGADRDAMLMGMALSRRVQFPVISLERALQIQDANLRRRTFDDIMWEVNSGDLPLGNGVVSTGMSEEKRREVNEWLRNAAIPADWKRTD